MRIRSSLPSPPILARTLFPQTAALHSGCASLLVMSLMLVFPGTSLAGGTAGGNTSLAAPTAHGGAGAGYDANNGGVTTTTGASGNAANGGGVGQNGTAGTSTSGGGGGGIGSSVTWAGNLTNAVTGGAGGGSTGSVGAGGGGDGVVLSSGGTVSVAVTGGAGGIATANPGGGGGGAGIVYTATGDTLTITKAVKGGGGGGAPRRSGGGGSGVWVTSAGIVNVTTGSVTGGAGGNSSTGAGAVNGGGGGAGVVFSAAGAALDVSGHVTGGDAVGPGGIGGAGVNIISGGVKVTVESGGSITGGTGGGTNGATQSTTGITIGLGGTGSGGTPGGNVNGQAPSGGIGIVAAGGGNTIVTSGSIQGGSAGGAQSKAITFSGVNNVLELLPGYSVVGNVLGDGATTLQLGGATGTAATFNASRLGPIAITGNNNGLVGFSSFQKIDGGIWTLTGATVTTVTPWTISGGTLSVSSDGALGATSGHLTLDGGTLQNTAAFTAARSVDLTANGGTLETAGADLTLSGVVAGHGLLTKEGDGSLILTGFVLPSGISIAQGTVQVGNGGTVGTIGVDVDVATSTGTTLAFDHSDPYAFGGVISGAGALSQIGSGTLSLTGDSSAFTGTSDVANGTLEVDGKLGGTLTVENGATLAGTGTVGTTTLASGAVLAPGNSATPVGTLNVNGNLTFAPGSTYQVQIPPGSTTSSVVNVSGTANLAGSVVHIGENGNYAGSSAYTILTADQLNGTFDSVSSNLAFLTPALFYDAHDVMLRLQMKENFADAAVTRNQRAVANALQSLSVDSALYNRILNLPNGAPQEAFDALSGESHASTASVLQGVTDNVISLPMAHLRADLEAPGAQPVWAQLFGNWHTLSGNRNAAKVEQSDGGVFVGADRPFANGWRLGGALGYTDSHSTVSDRASKFDIDSYSATAYGGKAFDAGPGKIKVTAGAAYTWSDIHSRRDVNGAGLDQSLKSTSGASTGQVFTELGYALPLNARATVEPFAGAAFSDQRLRGFSESGGFAALDGESKTNDVTTTTLGLHAQMAFTALQLQAHLHGTVGVRHAFGDVTPETTMAFEGSQPFTVAGAPIARNAGVTELGADITVSKNTTVGITYSGQFGAGYRQNAGNVNTNWRF